MKKEQITYSFKNVKTSVPEVLISSLTNIVKNGRRKVQ